MLVFRAGIYKTLIKIANREDPDQNAYSEAVLSGLYWMSMTFFGSNHCLKFYTIYHRNSYAAFFQVIDALLNSITKSVHSV